MNYVRSEMKESADRGQQMAFISDQCFSREGCFLIWAVGFLVLESRVWSLKPLALGNTKAQLLLLWERYHSRGAPQANRKCQIIPHFFQTQQLGKITHLFSRAWEGTESRDCCNCAFAWTGATKSWAWINSPGSVWEASIAEGVREPLELAPEWGIIEEWILADI